MSVLETPRVYFCGETTFDPVTTNNYPRNYDEMGAQTVLTPNGAVPPFRAAAIADVTSNGNWNPHGSYRSRFFGTRIVGVDLGQGTRSDDPFVGVPVNFLGMLVDLEPFGSMSSQLFFDQMSFGIEGGCQIAANSTMRFIARQINFARNPTYGCIAGVASVVWQTSFPKGPALPLYARGSSAIAALQKALDDDDVLGLTVRWNAYRTIYYDNLDCRNGNPVMRAESKDLQSKLHGGGFQPNPARSRVVGVLGLWRKGDAPQVVGDRSLQPGAGSPLGTATARLGPGRLVIDLGNSVPETGPDLAKQNLGPLAVFAGAQRIATLQPTDYDRTAYERSAGLVTVPLSDEAEQAAAGADLVVRDSTGIALLQEVPMHVCEITPNVYLDPGEPTHLQVQVLQRGAAVGQGVSVYWVNTSTSAPTLEVTQTDQSGVAALAVSGATSNLIGQIDCYVASTDKPPPAAVDTQRTAYLWVRTLPGGDDVAGLAPTWQNVYENVLYNWHAMAPCMDNWLRLDDPAQVAAYGPLIKQLTDRNNFERQRFMPVTRDLTAGQRTLLYAWLAVAQGQPAAGTTEARLRTPAPTAAAPSQRALSRSFRAGGAD